MRTGQVNCLQGTNAYFNQAVGFYLQIRGIPGIPQNRWSDEQSYDTAIVRELDKGKGVRTDMADGTQKIKTANENASGSNTLEVRMEREVLHLGQRCE